MGSGSTTLRKHIPCGDGCRSGKAQEETQEEEAQTMKKQRISQVTRARWGTGDAPQRAQRFTDRKKEANRNACRDRRRWD